MQNIGIPITQFISGWINKMDYIATHYGRRLNLLAILSILPYLSIVLLQMYLPKLIFYVLPLIENYIYMKEAKSERNPNATSLSPPNRNCLPLFL